MSSEDVEPKNLPLNLPEEDAILFGTTGAGKAVYYANRRNQLLVGFYDLDGDVFEYSLRFDVNGIGDAVQQFLNFPNEVTLSIIAEAFQDADTEAEHPYVEALLDAGFTAEDVAAVMPLSNREALRIAGEEVEE